MKPALAHVHVVLLLRLAGEAHRVQLGGAPLGMAQRLTELAGLRLPIHAQPSECACKECQAMCRARPCWPTPEEARALIDAGLAGKLMNDWTRDDVQLICPASRGHEGSMAPDDDDAGLLRFTMNYNPFPPCALQDAEGRCTIQSMKPFEGRTAHHSQKGHRVEEIHEAVGKSWDSDEGREVVKLFWTTIGAEARRA